MKTSFLRLALAIVLALFPAIAFSQESATPAPPPGAGITVYRQVTPDGRIVYSDKVVKGTKIDQTIMIDPPIKGNLWSTDSGTKPVVVPQIEQTPVNKVTTIPVPGKRKTLEEANSDVIRAEMLLEDAKKRQDTGIEPLPGERTGTASGGSRLNDAYQARQRQLAREVAEAEAVLKKSIVERNALPSPR